MEAARRQIALALGLVAWAGCSFKTISGGNGVPDAAICEDTSTMCTTPTTLRECTLGQPERITDCPWGCLAGNGPRCGHLLPTGTVVTATDLNADDRLVDITAEPSGTTGEINTDTGLITGVRPSVTTPGPVNGVDFVVREFQPATGPARSVGVFRFKSLTLIGDWKVRGANALAIVSLGEVVIEGRLDLRGDCTSPAGGPGGFAGGNANQDGNGEGAGARGQTSGNGNNDSSGGGGGADGADGGAAGKAASSPSTPAGGTAWGTADLSELLGGSGGAGAGNGGAGGGGGGAIHIAANGKVSIRAGAGLDPSGVNAGGCGGFLSGNNGGGGGGAGGAILIEAPEIELDGAHMAVNGGGGGGGQNSAPTGNGTAGQLGIARAPGGVGASSNGAGGGAGGASIDRTGEKGGDADNAGGGGGGVGRIRINTRLSSGVTVKNGALVSPTFEEDGTTATKSTANAQ